MCKVTWLGDTLLTPSNIPISTARLGYRSLSKLTSCRLCYAIVSNNVRVCSSRFSGFGNRLLNSSSIPGRLYRLIVKVLTDVVLKWVITIASDQASTISVAAGEFRLLFSQASAEVANSIRFAMERCPIYISARFRGHGSLTVLLNVTNPGSTVDTSTRVIG